MKTKRATLPWALAFLLGFAPLLARAAPPDDALAEALFAEGKRLFQEGNFGEACPKLAESQRLDPAGGTAVLLATCFDRDGKTASAWLAYKQALGLAMRDHNADRETIAREAIATLEPRVMSLRLHVAPDLTALPGLAIARDGSEWPAAAWDVTVPVDPGKHVIRAQATGREEIVLHLDLTEPGKTVDVVLPAFRAPPAVPPIATSAPVVPPPVHRASRHGPAIAALTTSGVLVIVGAVMAAEAASKTAAVSRDCPSSPCYSTDAQQKQSAARTFADVATVALAAGGVSAGLGAYLWLSSPTSPSHAAGLGFRGAF